MSEPARARKLRARAWTQEERLRHSEACKSKVRLTHTQKIEIIKLAESEDGERMSQADIATVYNKSRMTICKLLRPASVAKIKRTEARRQAGEEAGSDDAASGRDSPVDDALAQHGSERPTGKWEDLYPSLLHMAGPQWPRTTNTPHGLGGAPGPQVGEDPDTMAAAAGAASLLAAAAGATPLPQNSASPLSATRVALQMAYQEQYQKLQESLRRCQADLQALTAISQLIRQDAMSHAQDSARNSASAAENDAMGQGALNQIFEMLASSMGRGHQGLPAALHQQIAPLQAGSSAAMSTLPPLASLTACGDRQSLLLGAGGTPAASEHLALSALSAEARASVLGLTAPLRPQVCSSSTSVSRSLLFPPLPHQIPPSFRAASRSLSFS